MRVRLMLSEKILAQWWHPVASSEALDLLHRAMCTVSNHCIAIAIWTASKDGVFYQRRLFVCCPGGHRGNMEWVVTRWRRPEASASCIAHGPGHAASGDARGIHQKYNARWYWWGIKYCPAIPFIDSKKTWDMGLFLWDMRSCSKMCWVGHWFWYLILISWSRQLQDDKHHIKVENILVIPKPYYQDEFAQ